MGDICLSVLLVAKAGHTKLQISAAESNMDKIFFIEILLSRRISKQAQNMDIKVLSTILGHAQASTTLNLYAHALPDHKKDSMEKMRGHYRGYKEA